MSALLSLSYNIGSQRLKPAPGLAKEPSHWAGVHYQLRSQFYHLTLHMKYFSKMPIINHEVPMPQ